MTTLHAAQEQREARIAQRVLAGTVAEDPIGPDAPLRVSLDAYGHRRHHEAFGWAPRGSVDPVSGDRVYVTRADNGELIVLAWHPSAIDDEA